jgi:ParB/RepB/Spo0J family partition protein
MTARFHETAEEIKRNQSQADLAEKLDRLRSLPTGTVVPIPLELIDRDQNTRDGKIDSSAPEFRQLVETIREVGILQNPVVTILGDKIVCVAGHRRLAALEELGDTKPACVLRHFEKLETKQIAQLLENVARKALYPLEIAEQLARLQSCGYSQIRLQELIGKDRKTIGRYAKIASWPDEAKAIVRAHPDRLRAGVLLRIASKSLSDEELVEILREHAGPSKSKQMASRGGASSRRLLYQRAESYFAERDFTQRDRELVWTVLKDLGILPLEGGGILDPTPLAPTRATAAAPTKRKGAQQARSH